MNHFVQRSGAILGGSLLVSFASYPFATKEWKKEIFSESFAWSGINAALQLVLSPLDARVSQIVSDLLFALEMQKGFALVHESGHYLAAKLLVQKKPTLSLGADRASTNYDPSILSPLGERFGQKKVVCMALAAGPLMDLLTTGILFTAGRLLQSSHPSLGSSFITSSGVNFVKCIAYALSADQNRDSTHDYVLLNHLGAISPLSAATMIASLPIFLSIATR